MSLENNSHSVDKFLCDFSSLKENKNEWLSTTDIYSVMEQYQKAYPEFMFVGTVPVLHLLLNFSFILIVLLK